VLDCAQLPERSDRGNLCIDPPPDHATAAGDDENHAVEHAAGSVTDMPYNPGWAKLLDAFRGGGVGQRVTRPPPAPVATSPAAAARCRADRLVATTARNDSTPRCAVRCGVDVLFRAGDKGFMATWMTVCASLCLVASVFAVATFVADPSRFDYPQRPVACLTQSCPWVHFV